MTNQLIYVDDTTDGICSNAGVTVANGKLINTNDFQNDGQIICGTITALDATVDDLNVTEVTAGSIVVGPGPFNQFLVENNGNTTTNALNVTGEFTVGSSVQIHPSGNMEVAGEIHCNDIVAINATSTFGTVNTSSLNASNMNCGTTLVSNLTVGNGSFSVESNGHATTSDLTVNGGLTAGSGAFSVDSSGNTTTNDLTVDGAIGYTDLTVNGVLTAGSGAFSVDSSGNTTTNDLTVDGAIGYTDLTVNGVLTAGSGAFSVDSSGNTTTNDLTVDGAIGYTDLTVNGVLTAGSGAFSVDSSGNTTTNHLTVDNYLTVNGGTTFNGQIYRKTYEYGYVTGGILMNPFYYYQSAGVGDSETATLTLTLSTVGSEVIVQCSDLGTSATMFLVPLIFIDGSQLQFTAKNQYAKLIYLSAGWKVIDHTATILP